MSELIEELTDAILEAEKKYQVDALLRTLICLIEAIEDEV